MSINYIPNDPSALASMPMIQKKPRKNRPSGRAGFTFVGAVRQKNYSFATPEFLFWQCREAALAAVETWEALDGKLMNWARSPNLKKLELDPRFNGDPQMVGPTRLNAYYDGDGLRFFDFRIAG